METTDFLHSSSILILTFQNSVSSFQNIFENIFIEYDVILIPGWGVTDSQKDQLISVTDHAIKLENPKTIIAKNKIYLTPAGYKVTVNNNSILLNKIENHLHDNQLLLNNLIDSIPVSASVEVKYITSHFNNEVRNTRIEKNRLVEVETFRALFDNSLLAFFQTNAKGQILEANKASCDMFGYSPEEFKKVGRNKIIENSQEYQQLLKQRKQFGYATGQITGIRKSGEKFKGDYSSRIFKDHNNNERASTIIIDVNARVTEEERIKQSARFMKMILDNTEESFIIIDHELNVISFNKPAEGFAVKLIKVPLKTGNSIFSLAHEADIPRLQQMYQHILKGNEVTSKYSVKVTDDHSTVFKISYHPIFDESKMVSHIMVNAKDITAEEEALQQITKEQAALHKALSEIQRIMHASPDIICTLDNQDGKFIRVSAAATNILGYEPDEMIGMPFTDFVFHEDLEKSLICYKEILEGDITTNFENRYKRKDGTLVPLHWSVSYDLKDKIVYAIARDATEKIRSEKALLDSEEKYRHLFYSNPLPMWIYNVSTKKFLEVNDAAIDHYGFSREEFLTKTIFDIRPQDELQKLNKVFIQNRGTEFFHHTWKHLKKNGEKIDVEISSHVIDYNGMEAVLVSANDITKRIQLEENLLKNNNTVRNILESITDGFLSVDHNWIISYCNSESEKIIGKSSHELVCKNLWDVSSETIPKKFIELFKKAIQEKKSVQLEHYLEKFNIWLDITGYPSNDGLSLYFKNITERKLVEKQVGSLNKSLEKRAAQLSASNMELENFAYVASHDLQEPLRMITSFLQLLDMKYHDKLDSAGNKYIRFAVDGATRMNSLILDLLEYAKVGRNTENTGQVDFNEIIKNVLENFQQKIISTKAVISYQNLPVLDNVNKSQMSQLLQNLIGNAIKYQVQGNIPNIIIEAESSDSEWLFSIKDNGIGIDDKFASKIFVIFQRLHSKNEYSGTGIGLAICKKIVELHGGKIGARSKPGEGSTFWFTIPFAPRIDENEPDVLALKEK